MINDNELRLYKEGLFKPYFEKFIIYKRSRGEKVVPSAVSLMKHLNDSLNSYETLEVTPKMVEEITLPRTDVSDNARYRRIIALRQFLSFLEMLGIKCYQLPPRYIRPPKSEFRPYIFNNDEVIRLIYAADNLRRWRHRERRTENYPVIIRILIGTGMRIGEVLFLKRSDIDLDNGVIKVINGKNDVCRYIPVSESLKLIIQDYMTAYANEENDFLFKSPRTGHAYSYDTIEEMFHKLCIAAKIYMTNGRTPNMHSLRHTFCSKSLEQMLDSEMDLYTAIPILAAYVGHVNYSDTEMYIHFTEKGCQDFIDKQEPLKRIIPEVDYDE